MKGGYLAVYAVEFVLLLLYMGYLSRGEKATKLITGAFTNGGTEALTIAFLLITVMEWCSDGWDAISILGFFAFAIIVYVVGRRLEKIHNSLNHVR